MARMLHLNVLKVWVLAGCLLFPLMGHAAVTHVTFPDATGQMQLPAELYRPDGSGPFPAVVFLHGCGGLFSRGHDWAQKLQSWGYVVLRVDSLSPRGQTNICQYPFRVDPKYMRMPDAYAAKWYLSQLPFVDRSQIGLIGWSHGGWTALYVVDTIYLQSYVIGRDAEFTSPFQAAIAFYPMCLDRIFRLNTALLILIGEADDWTPASRCQTMLVEHETDHRVTLKVYPGAHNGFDGLGPVRSYLGHMLGRHPEAAEQADRAVKQFLGRHLRRRPDR